MCLQPALEDAECLWRSDSGWQNVPDARSSDEERPVITNIVERRDDCVTRAEHSRLLASMSATRHSSFARYRYGGPVPCRQRKTSTASLNSIRSRTGNQWRSRSSGVICSYTVLSCRANKPCCYKYYLKYRKYVNIQHWQLQYRGQRYEHDLCLQGTAWNCVYTFMVQ